LVSVTVPHGSKIRVADDRAVRGDEPRRGGHERLVRRLPPRPGDRQDRAGVGRTGRQRRGGRYVTFDSDQSNLVERDTNDNFDAFVPRPEE